MKTITKKAILFALPLLMSANAAFAQVDGTPEEGFPYTELGFEDTGATGFAAGWWPNTANWVLNTDAQYVHDGLQSMCCFVAEAENSTMPTNIQMQKDPGVTFLAGKNYVMTCWVFIPSDYNACLSSFEMNIVAPWINLYVYTDAIERDKWVQLQSQVFSFTEETTTKLGIKPKFNTTLGTGDVMFYFDTFEVYDADELGIDAIHSAKNSSVAVAGANGTIAISGANMGEEVSVYTIDGSQVAATTVGSDMVLIPAAPANIYLVKVGNKVTKVAL